MHEREGGGERKISVWGDILGKDRETDRVEGAVRIEKEMRENFRKTYTQRRAIQTKLYNIRNGPVGLF